MEKRKMCQLRKKKALCVYQEKTKPNKKKQTLITILNISEKNIYCGVSTIWVKNSRQRSHRQESEKY